MRVTTDGNVYTLWPAAVLSPPKDGKPFLAWCPVKKGLGDDAAPDGEWRVVWWETRGQFTSDRDLGNEEFTVWTYLPPDGS